MIWDKIKTVAGIIALACVAILILVAIDRLGEKVAIVAIAVIAVVIAIFAIIVIALLVKGFLPLEEKERAGITRFGKFNRALKEGWHLTIPIIEKAKRMSIKKRGIAIYEEKKEPWYDFNGGGSGQPLKLQVWIKGDDGLDKKSGKENLVYKALFEIDDYEGLIKSHTAAAMKNFVNAIKVEEVFSWYEPAESGSQADISKVDILTEMRKPRTASLAQGLQDTVEETGHTLEAIFADDWNFSDDVKNKRREVYEAEMDAKKAPLKADARDIQIGGAIRKIVDTLVKEGGYPKTEAEKIAPGLFKHMTASEGNQLSLHEFDGLVPEGDTGDSGSSNNDLFSPANITRAVEIFKTIMGSTSTAKSEKTEKEEPKEKLFRY